MFLRMVARPLMAKVKQTTGIKKDPEDVVESSREVLIRLYSRILNQLKDLPKDHSYREYMEEYTNDRLKVCQEEEEDEEYIAEKIHFSPIPIWELIDKTRHEILEVSGVVADWQSRFTYTRPTRPLPLRPLSRKTIYGKPSERELLIQLYYQALNVVRKVPPENNELRMFAESSITRKLEVCRKEFDWESIKSKLDYEDPIQKAQEELDHWILFFGPDAYPGRQYPHVPRTKEFYERFNAWREFGDKFY